METPILSKVIRGETVESVHRGHLIVLAGDGEVLFSIGDPQTVTYFRSASKPFQALPFITSGAAGEFGFTDEEVALACASHSGEPVHVAIASRMLERIGLKESDLQCGTHLPFNENESERLLNCNAARICRLTKTSRNDCFVRMRRSTSCTTIAPASMLRCSHLLGELTPIPIDIFCRKAQSSRRY